MVAQYRELERSFLRLADLLAASDPRQAKLLRTAFDRAREGQVGERLEAVVGLLEKEQLLKAGTGQQGALERLRELLELLTASTSGDRRAGVKQQVRELLARLGKVIARQREVEGATESGAGAEPLAERQRALAEETRRLTDDIGGFARRVDDRQPAPDKAAERGGAPDGPAAPAQDPPGSAEPPDSPPGSPPGTPAAGRPGAQPPDAAPGDGAEGSAQPGEQPPSAAEPEPAGDDDASRAKRAAARLRAAEERMRAAERRLDETDRAAARREQEQAAEELETARAELDEILRQIREQEVEQLLLQLETRVRDMLRAERSVLAAVERVAAEREAGRDRELEAARLGREQAAVGGEASKAVVLVRDDGTAVVVLQALESIRDDALQAAERLTRADFGGGTRGLLEDLVTGLEELLAALEKGRQEAREQRPPAGGGRPGEPAARPLVDRIAELKMLRSLQLRVNARTRRLSSLLVEGSERAAEPDLLEALARLAERQQAIERAARDIVAGRTE